ncbi:DUF2125 domain-containing protein [Methylobacterium currus]|uniref:DUF2125 domain-containing protein n=1 Tax=Methylobacterium currus TaxID=2051553 RepID=A0A2R4WIM6_9HYPH|nr:DUF2125 domain-containing protein [Methylobacterium currus]AWB21388.1 DUF2125 domain-containing protein [Methylobacterium currus]UHC13858.1 DUF2125 domain-containing protein [Methylobacterium currus]
MNRPTTVGPTDDTPPSQSAGRGPGRGPGLRLGLFAPFALLLLLALVWSAGWFWLRGRAEGEIDAWFTREAQAGRQWTCADRSLTGFPFRFELRCTQLGFARSDVRFTTGPLVAVAQVYQPRHVILEATGPFRVQQGGLDADVTWSQLEASLHVTGDGFQRASLVANGLKGAVTGADPSPIDFTVGHLELHARPTPGRFATDGAVDLSARVLQAGLPLLDPVLGGPEPADIALDATVTRAAGLRTRTLAQELERWREAGGAVEIASLAAEKGSRRLRAQGVLALDDEHRPTGQLDVRTAGLEQVIAPLISEQIGARLGGDGAALIGNIVGQFLGGRRKEPAPGQGAPDPQGRPGEPPLKVLPTVRLTGGRVVVGPFAVPNVRLQPLY